MGKKDNEPSDGMEKLFSTQGILIAILILGLYWVFFGEDNNRESRGFNFTTQNVPIGISDQLNPEALEKLGIDLTEHLDPKLIPAITSEAIRETTQENVSKDSFLPILVSKISNKIRDVSTIDLNKDGRLNDRTIKQTASKMSLFFQFWFRIPIKLMFFLLFQIMELGEKLQKTSLLKL